MKFLIAGDFVIKGPYEGTRIDPRLTELFRSSDYNIVNLEAPVTDSKHELDKTGPHHKAHKPSTAEILKLLNVDIVTLANNHLLDYGTKGVEDTLSFCKENSIATVGGGLNLKEASKTFYLETPVGKIAILNFAENEWSSATTTNAGANPMNLIENVKQIKQARALCDFVLVIVHGGHEYYNLPSPRMQQQYRFYADQGADIIVGHHTHCISGYEIYNNTPIYYGLGNFLFTKSHSNDDWYKGLILEIELNEHGLKSLIHPVNQNKGDFQLSLLEGNEKAHILKRVQSYSGIIENEKLLEKEWGNFISSRYLSYIRSWSQFTSFRNRYLQFVFNKITHIFITKSRIRRYLNLIRCEAHSDLSKEVMQRYLQDRS